MQPAVFLDRDNTLIANDGDLGDPTAVHLLDGVPEGLHALREAGYRLVVVTNQAGVARGRMTERDVDLVHARIAHLVDSAMATEAIINRFYYCPYHPEAPQAAYRRHHPWRKPSPGMLLQAARDLNLDLSRSWMVGDQSRDIEAGRSAGCRTVLMNRDLELARTARPTVSVETFPDVVRTILDGAPPFPPQTPDPGAGPNPAPKRSPAPDRTPRSSPPTHAEPDFRDLHRSIVELTEQIRVDQGRRVEFTGLRLAALMTQLLVVLLAVLGVLQIANPQLFMMWMGGAVLVQLLTIAMLLLDQR